MYRLFEISVISIVQADFGVNVGVNFGVTLMTPI